MATTTNYSWSTPDDTALVKDGAAAIRSLGTAIDTTVFNNAGAAVAKATVDAKGDLIAGTADNTVARLAVGTNGQVLTVDSTTATGLAYTTPAAGGGMTLIATTTFNNTVDTYTYSSLGSYKHLLILIDNMNTSAGASVSNLSLRMNGVTSGNYQSTNWGFREAQNFSVDNQADGTAATIRDICPNSTQGTGQRGQAEIWIYDYNGSTRKTYYGMARGYGTSNVASILTGYLDTTNAITSVTILNAQANNFNNGTLKLYGVS
jgi:hypothetical protein